MNLFRNLLTMLFALMSLASWGQVNLDSLLVAHYPFDGNANDSIGNNEGNNNGATLAPNRFGIANGAYYFDGNDYVNVGDSAAFQMGTSSFTLGVWFKSDLNTVGVIAGKRAWVGGIDPVYTISYSSSSQQVYGYWRFDDGTTTGWPIANGITPGEWHHAVFVFDRTSTAKIYIDGAYISQSSSLVGNTKTMNSTGGKFQIGKDDYFNQYIKGSIDDVRVYKRALSADEIYILYKHNAGI